MTTYPAVDVSGFRGYQSGSDSAMWWGTAALVAAEAVIYAGLIASYFYERQGASNWPPGYLDVPTILWPTVGTALRIAAEPCMLLAGKSAQRDNNSGIVAWLGAALVLAIGWMVLIVEYMFHENYDWTYATYGSMNWLMTSWAFICVASMITWGLVVWTWALKGHFNRWRRTGLECLKMYWTLQTVGWVFFWLIIYFGPRVFHKP